MVKLFQGYGANIKKTFAETINKKNIQKVGKFLKPIAQAVNTGAMLLNTPVGQALLYSAGALAGPAGLAVANAISMGSKALLIGTSLALGTENIYSGTKMLAESGQKNDSAGIAKGLGQLALGVAGAGVGFARGVKALESGLNPTHLEKASKWANTTLGKEASKEAGKLIQGYKNTVGWDVAKPLGGALRDPKSGNAVVVNNLGGGRSFSIKPFKPIGTKQPREEVIRAYGTAGKHPNFSPIVTSTSEPIKKISSFTKLYENVSKPLGSVKNAFGNLGQSARKIFKPIDVYEAVENSFVLNEYGDYVIDELPNWIPN